VKAPHINDRMHNRIINTEAKKGRVRFQDIEKPKPLPSYVAQEAYHRRMEQETEIEKYTGDPPAGIQLIQVSCSPNANMAAVG
jgi:hypothetical protein